MVSQKSVNIPWQGDTGGGRHTVFPSKLRPPALSPNWLHRERLMHGLRAYGDTDLTVLCAPPGFGKTTLLCQWYEWLRKKAVDAVWLTLDPEDRHKQRFLLHIAFVLGLYRDGEGPGSHRGGACSDKKSVQCLLGDIYNALYRRGGPVVVILDACDQVDSRKLSKTICQFQTLMPENLHIAIATRLALPGLTTRLWSCGKVNSMTGEDLYFTESEVADLLGEKVSQSLVAYVYEKTRGWPMAVQLFQRIVAQAGAELPIKDTALPQRVLAPLREYIREQVVRPLPQVEQRTLLMTALLREIAAGLANRLCQSDRAAAVLHSLTRLQPLVSRSGDEPATYSVNPLLRDCLQAGLQSFSESERRQLLTVIVDWYIDKRDIAAAVYYVRLCGDARLAAKCVACFGGNAITLQAGITALRAVLEIIDAADMARSTRLIIANAVVLMKDGHLSLAQHKLHQARSILEEESTDEDRAYGPSRVDYIAATYLLALYNNENFNRDYLERCEIEAYRNTADDGIIGFVHALKSLLYQRNSSFLRAEAEAGKSLRHYKTAKSNYGIGSVCLIMGLCSVAKGQFHLALRSYENAQRIIRRDFADDPGLNAIVESLCAEIRYERNQTENLFQALQGVVDVLESYDGWLDTYAVAYRVVIFLALAQRDFEKAYMFLERMAVLAGERGLEELNRLALLWRINACMREEKYAAADNLYTQYSGHYGALSELSNRQVIWREYDEYHFTTARLLMARNGEKQVLALLEPLIANAHKSGRLLSLAKAHILQSRAYQLLDMQEEAIAVLRHAAAIGSAEKYMRVFLDEDSGIVAMLQHIVDGEKKGKVRTKLGQYCAGIISAFQRESAADKAAIALTPRERQILTGLSRGNASKMIARDLGVTESTVKFHLKKIYAKLGVNKRSAAVVEARRLRVIH